MKTIQIRGIERWLMDPCCWTCVSLNKNSGWRIKLRMESGLLDRYLFQAGSMDEMDRWIWIDSLNQWTNRRS